jgi:hypothetical protein
MLRKAKVRALDRLVPAIRDLYLRLPETRHLQAWELQWILYALNFTDELEDEGEIAAAVEVARRDYPRRYPRRRPAA